MENNHSNFGFPINYWDDGKHSERIVHFFLYDYNFEKVWNKYCLIDGIYLSQLTHQKNTAWSKADDRDDTFLNDHDIFEEEEYEIVI